MKLKAKLKSMKTIKHIITLEKIKTCLSARVKKNIDIIKRLKNLAKLKRTCIYKVKKLRYLFIRHFNSSKRDNVYIMNK